MLNVAITFDYELFFGKNLASDDEILFSPTAELLAVLKKHNMKATFFVDVLSVYMHEKRGLTSYCENFIKQMQQMVKEGHDVQLHIHSNWLTAEYNDDKWIFNLDSYNIHSFGFDSNKEMSANAIIQWGKNFLETNLRVIDPHYACIAYRAGGYCIQPHKELFDALNTLYDEAYSESTRMKQLVHELVPTYKIDEGK